MCFNPLYSAEDGTVYQMWNRLLNDFCFSSSVKKYNKKETLRSGDRLHLRLKATQLMQACVYIIHSVVCYIE